MHIIFWLLTLFICTSAASGQRNQPREICGYTIVNGMTDEELMMLDFRRSRSAHPIVAQDPQENAGEACFLLLAVVAAVSLAMGLIIDSNQGAASKERERRIDESIERLPSMERNMAKSLRAAQTPTVTIHQSKAHQLDGAELIVTDTRHAELRRTS